MLRISVEGAWFHWIFGVGGWLDWLARDRAVGVADHGVGKISEQQWRRIRGQHESCGPISSPENARKGANR